MEAWWACHTSVVWGLVAFSMLGALVRNAKPQIEVISMLLRTDVWYSAYRMSCSHLRLIVTLNITNHYLFQLSYCRSCNLQTCVVWVSIDNVNYDQQPVILQEPRVSLCTFPICCFLVYLMHKAFSAKSVYQRNIFMLLAMIWCGLGWQAWGSRVEGCQSSSIVTFRWNAVPQ